jgi:chromosome segregation ATPase
MKNKPLFNKEISQKQNNQISHKTKESEDDTGDKSPNTSDFGISTDNNSVKDLKARVKFLEQELADKDSEIDFLKEKLTNNQEILLDVIEDKKSLKKIVQDFEMKQIDERLNNFQQLQRKQHQIEHRLFVTKNQLDEARNELKIQEKVIKDLEKRGLRDYLMANYPQSYVQYQKKV